MGQISMKISALPGSVLSENQQGVVSPLADAQVAAQFADMDAIIKFRAFHNRLAKIRIVSKSLLPSELAGTRHLTATTFLTLG